MRSNDERIAELHRLSRRQAREAARRRFRAACAGMSAVTLALTVFMATAVSRTKLSVPALMPESRTASIFTQNDALGYVVITILAFTLGVLLTVFCFRLKKRLDEKERRK